MRVVDNAHDLVIRHVETYDRFWRPSLRVLPQRDDGRFAVHFTHRHSPWNRRALIATEVRRVDEPAGEPVGDAHAGVGRDQFAESVPVSSVESLDVEV